MSSADSILSTIAGGLIAAVTLLLSLVLVTVQLASTQFSPRTLRDWIGDPVQRRTIGIVLGTTVYCLLVLRETRTVSADVELAPHLSVLVAVPLAVLSLVAVVRSVDHLSDGMRIGSVARKLAADTVAAVEGTDALSRPGRARISPTDAAHLERSNRHDAVPLPAPISGWIQSVDIDGLLEALPRGATVHLCASTGSFVLPGEPLGWASRDVDERAAQELSEAAFHIGDVRSLEGDIRFGLLQMSDIALRALSPGVNDPNTAADVSVHVGVVMLALWERPDAPNCFEHDGCCVVIEATSHADYLEAGYAQIIRYAQDEHDVLAAITRSLLSLRREVVRRDLPGPVEPIDAMLERIDATVARSSLAPADKERLHRLVRSAEPERTGVVTALATR